MTDWWDSEWPFSVSSTCKSIVQIWMNIVWVYSAGVSLLMGVCDMSVKGKLGMLVCEEYDWVQCKAVLGSSENEMWSESTAFGKQ